MYRAVPYISSSSFLFTHKFYLNMALSQKEVQGKNIILCSTVSFAQNIVIETKDKL